MRFHRTFHKINNIDLVPVQCNCFILYLGKGQQLVHQAIQLIRFFIQDLAIQFQFPVCQHRCAFNVIAGYFYHTDGRFKLMGKVVDKIILQLKHLLVDVQVAVNQKGNQHYDAIK
ncbi:hypothetical protein D3C87_1517810 [compost metagenome]